MQLKQSTWSGIDPFTVGTGKMFGQIQNQYTANDDCPSAPPKRTNQQVTITPDKKERMEQNCKEAQLKRQQQGQLNP